VQTGLSWIVDGDAKHVKFGAICELVVNPTAI